jgi:pyruvate kinase
METRIICTIGPASSDSKTLKGLISAGMAVARINFSHGKLAHITGIIRKIRALSAQAGKKVIILGDLQGPKIRIGQFKKAPVCLRENDEFTFTSKQIIGTKHAVSVDYPELYKYLSHNDLIFLDDGKIELVVKSIRSGNINCRVIIGGELNPRKGLSVLNKIIPLPGVTAQDKVDLAFGIKEGMDWFAHSFVRKASHVTELRKLAAAYGAKDIFVVSKIEDRQGFRNVDEIIKVSNGIMVARGDLGVSVDRALVPIMQKQIVEKCNKARKTDIVATQILDSMIHNPYPTRAEVNDVAVAVMQETDYLLLSGETAVGKYPVQTTAEMARIISVIQRNKIS